MRRALDLFSVVLMAGLLWPEPAAAGRRRGRPADLPNIVVILTDDQRPDTVAHMPAVLDRIAAEGVTLRNSFATTPVCWSSRISFLTGLYTHNTGSAQPTLDPAATIARRLQQRGYRTGLFGKYLNGYGSQIELVNGEPVVTLGDISVPLGWDEWRAFAAGSAYYDYLLSENGQLGVYGNAEQDYSTDVLAAMAVDFVRESAPGPFFLVFTPYAPHAPAVPAPRHAGALSGRPPWRGPSFQEGDLADKPSWVHFMRFLWETQSPAEQAQRLLDRDQFQNDQIETLLAVDEAVAALFAELDAQGLTDETFVVFTSDNGYAWDEHWWSSKFAVYEGSIRTPLLIRWPDAAPRDEDGIALNIDLAPTFAKLAGVPGFAANGRSLLPLLAGTASNWRSDFLIEWWQIPYVLMPTYQAVRSADWKYVWNAGSPPFEELYDLNADPDELANVLVTDPGNPAWQPVLDQLRARRDALELE